MPRRRGDLWQCAGGMSDPVCGSGGPVSPVGRSCAVLRRAPHSGTGCPWRDRGAAGRRSGWIEPCRSRRGILRATDLDQQGKYACDRDDMGGEPLHALPRRVKRSRPRNIDGQRHQRAMVIAFACKRLHDSRQKHLKEGESIDVAYGEQRRDIRVITRPRIIEPLRDDLSGGQYECGSPGCAARTSSISWETCPALPCLCEGS